MAIRTLTIRRRIVFLDHVENRAPGRMAYVVYRTRNRSRDRAAISYQLLAEWLERRQQQLATEHPAAVTDTDQTDADQTRDSAAPTPDAAESNEPSPSPQSDSETGTDDHERPAATDDHEPRADADDDRPTDGWTKGRLYELARSYDLAGRSKLNKAELLDTVVAEWDRRHDP